VRTERTARRYRDAVVPGTTVVDEPGLGRIFAGWTIELPATSFALPALIVAGRQDATAGFVGAMDLLASYPGASLVVADGAGHALMHERPDLLAAVLTDWLERASAGTR
jgi:pimeloyl-ACP methyl ester carboxylesterase